MTTNVKQDFLFLPQALHQALYSDEHAARSVLLATIPRSGTLMMQNFFYFYNAALSLDIEDLPHYLVQSAPNLAHYRSLGIGEFIVGHCFCPGFEDGVYGDFRSAWEAIPVNPLYVPIQSLIEERRELLYPQQNPAARIVFLYRNPFDQLLSHERHHQNHISYISVGKTRHEIYLGLLQDYVKTFYTYHAMAQAFPANLLLVRYEDLKRSQAGALAHILAFMGHTLDTPQRQAAFGKALHLVQPAQMRALELRLGRTLANDQRVSVQKESHMRGGETGKWKGALDEEIIASARRIFGDFGFALEDFVDLRTGQAPLPVSYPEPPPPAPALPVMDAEAADSRRWFSAAAGRAFAKSFQPQPVLLEQNYRGYNLVEYGFYYLALSVDIGPVDLAALTPTEFAIWRSQSRASAAETLDSLKALVDGSPYRPSPVLLEENFHGFNLLHYQDRFFAVAISLGAVDLPFLDAAARQDLFAKGKLLSAASLAELKSYLSAMQEVAHPSVALFIPSGNVLLSKKVLASLPHETVHILVPASQRNSWSGDRVYVFTDAAGGEMDVVDLNRLSPHLLAELQQNRYDQLVAFYEPRLAGPAWEHLADAVSNRLLAVFPNGKSRLYEGKNLKRLLYNLSYLRTMLANLPSLEGKKVLEIGSSDGLTCDFIANELPELVAGVDYWALEGFIFHNERTAYAQGDALALPFPDCVFDVCYSIATFEHITDPPAALREIHRVTRPGGYIYIQSAPLYHSPFGHHMFGFFDDYPWIHLRLSPEEIIAYCRRTGIDQTIEATGRTLEETIHSFLSPDHINGKFLRQYRLDEFARQFKVKQTFYRPSLEGENLLTPEIRAELARFDPHDLTAHGFEVIYQRQTVAQKKSTPASNVMPKFSFLLPTRGRPDLVARLFDSIVETTTNLDEIEIVMAVDDDDLPSQVIQDERLNIKKVVLKRGATMGQLNQACFDASNGRFVIIANDDIILRTPAWDERVSAVFALYPDDIALVHVNDLLFRERLCTFPIISRRACLEAGLTLPGYRRYKIDDHLYDIYSMLAYLGHKRIVYLPEVIFEHDNHDNALVDHANEHIFKSDDQKVYTPKKGIIEQDHELFMSTFAQRKNAAAALARLIDDTRFGAAQARQQAEAYRLHPAARTHLYRSVLGDLPDPYSYRWPDLVKTFSIAPEGWLHSPRVTVAVVTANIQHPFAAECIRRVKQYTHNYDLVILDNNRGPDFKHAREMNKILRITQSDYLVLMDDDVYVEEGWLDGLLRAMDEQTGVVVPLHTGQDGKVNFSGMYLACDDSGNHEHLVDIPAAPREAQVVCSAIMLMELRKVGRIFMDEKYSKYFFDPVYSCEVWEAGYKVMVTPEVTVAHLGGATMVRGTQEAGGLWARDGEIFTNDWVKTGRLEKLFPVWAQYPALQPLVAIPQQINTLFQSALKLSDAQFEQQLTACIDTARAYPLFQKLIALRAQQTASKLAEQGAQVKARLCQAALKFLVVNEQIDYQTSPVLVQGNYKGFNIVHFRQKYIALSIALGTIDLTHTPQEKLDGYNTAGQCFITATLEEAKAQVDALARQPQPEGILVSAIVSTYNAERFMRACLEDLEAQTLRDHLEIIVIDSGSQQNERAIVAEFKKKYPNIVYLRTERENHHLAMNRGIALARGRYVTMANTDDRHHPDAFRRMAEIMERDASIGVVYHDSAITSRENAALYSGPVSGRFRWPDFDRKLLFQICFLGPQPMWRKALHEQYGGYDAEYTTAGDYELWLRLSDKTRFYHLPQVLGLYYESPASNEHKNAGLAAAESDRARRKHWRAADGPLPPSLGPIFLERYQALPAGFPAGNFPLVSVIIPTYNRPAELRAALQSVVEQTYPNLEVIVVNDAGEDVSAVLRAFEGRRPLRCIVQPANQGAGAARNAGILAAQGKYLAFLDDDDAFHPEHLFLLAAELDQRPALAAAYSDALQAAFHIKKNEKARLAGKQVAFSQDFTVDELLARNYIPMLCLMARAEAVEEAGLFDAALPALEDWEWLIRLAQAGPFSHLPLVTAEYVVREGGSSRNMLSAGQIQELYLRIYQKHATLASRAARELQRRVYGFKTGRDLSLDAPALFAAPAAAAPSRAQETFRLLLNADDISAALQQYRNRFDAGLLALVHSNAAAARADGQAELAEGLDDLAAYIAEVVEGK